MSDEAVSAAIQHVGDGQADRCSHREPRDASARAQPLVYPAGPGLGRDQQRPADPGDHEAPPALTEGSPHHRLAGRGGRAR